MIRRTSVIFAAATLFFWSSLEASAHFGMVIPSENVVTQQKKTVDLTLSFSHPFEQNGMELVKPKQFFVLGETGKQDLRHLLKEIKVMGAKSWQATFSVQRPGAYQFVMEPVPYWEPAEDVSIVHYTKTIIAAYGDETGWDTPAGLPTEIVPLTRPFGNYAGNSFSGLILLNGKPVPFGEVEVELYNQESPYKAPSDFHVTQVVKADKNGVFTFTCPVAGWWGFAALNEANYTLKNPEGINKNVELGAVLWIYLDKYAQ